MSEGFWVRASETDFSAESRACTNGSKVRGSSRPARHRLGRSPCNVLRCGAILFVKLLAKIDWDSGAIISNMSFGDDTYGSGFNTVLIGGSRAYCAGYTNDIAADGGYTCWFAEIDISNPPTSQFAAVDRVATNGTVKPILPDRRMTPHRSR